MTKKPPARLSRPRTGPAAPAPAHGDGPTRPTAPTGRTEARGCPFGFRHYNCDCKPLEATTPEPADRPPLRDQIAEALYRHTMDHAAGGPARLLTRDETVLWENSLARADAVMPVIEAETAALRQRAEQAERERDDYHQRFTNQMSAATDLIRKLERAERQHAEALDQIAAERRGRLAAEAAVRRVRQVLDGRARLCGPDAIPSVPVAAVRAALDAEQPKESP